MKDRYGYITFSQKNYDPKHKRTVNLQARKVVSEGNPQIQFVFELNIVKSGRLFREVGALTLTGDDLAEFVAMTNE